MTLDAGGGAEALLVLWTGGWADLEFVDVEACVAVADALVARLLDRARSG